ncbi:hypothetical protein BDP27DRAFT_1430486 [Rhodocollybia butyracea]|uniref:JmjC domain-containing protein n=1 Tax=Rhodocollybia butyracea TaxID=206335 RepID=A0A9P5TYR6_9AGAR|nr:hypothetical protein BDP27DRAFT_1430486 [Rhodocollybia butyracea]
MSVLEPLVEIGKVQKRYSQPRNFRIPWPTPQTPTPKYRNLPMPYGMDDPAFYLEFKQKLQGEHSQTLKVIDVDQSSSSTSHQTCGLPQDASSDGLAGNSSTHIGKSEQTNSIVEAVSHDNGGAKELDMSSGAVQKANREENSTDLGLLMDKMDLDASSSAVEGDPPCNLQQVSSSHSAQLASGDTMHQDASCSAVDVGNGDQLGGGGGFFSSSEHDMDVDKMEVDAASGSLVGGESSLAEPVQQEPSSSKTQVPPVENMDVNMSQQEDDVAKFMEESAITGSKHAREPSVDDDDDGQEERSSRYALRARNKPSGSAPNSQENEGDTKPPPKKKKKVTKKKAVETPEIRKPEISKPAVSLFRPVQLDLPKLVPSTKAKKEKYPAVEIWTGDGKESTLFEWEPYAKKNAHDWYQQLTNNVKSFGPDSPHIRVISHEELNKTSATEIQESFRTKLLLIRGVPTTMKFDEDSFLQIGNIDVPRTIHDTSLYDPEEPHSVHVQGSLRDFLKSDKILNSLSNPLATHVQMDHLATDFYAVKFLSGTPPIGFTPYYPRSLMDWIIATKMMAEHMEHMDVGGTCTKILVQDGAKWWLVCLPKNKKHGTGWIPAYGAALANSLNADVDYEWFGIWLRPGDLLCLPPATIHIVFTVEDSICSGGYFVSSATMAKTVFANYHNFVASSYLTNAPVSQELTMILRVLFFWYLALVEQEKSYFKVIKGKASTPSHIPDLRRVEDLVNLLALLNLADLAWVISPERYAGEKEPQDYKSARECASCFREWLYKKFRITRCQTDGQECEIEEDFNMLENLGRTFLFRHARLLVRHIANFRREGFFSEDVGDGKTERYVTSTEVCEAIEEDLCPRDYLFQEWWTRARGIDEKVEALINKLVVQADESSKIEIRKEEWRDVGNSYEWEGPGEGYVFRMDIVDN